MACLDRDKEKMKNYKDRLGTVAANYRRQASTHAKPDFQISWLSNPRYYPYNGLWKIIRQLKLSANNR